MTEEQKQINRILQLSRESLSESLIENLQAAFIRGDEYLEIPAGILSVQEVVILHELGFDLQYDIQLHEVKIHLGVDYERFTSTE